MSAGIPDGEKIVAHIAEAISHAAPTVEQATEMQDTLLLTEERAKGFRVQLLTLCVAHAERCRKEHPSISKPTMLRTVASDLIHTAAFVVRSFKRMQSEELCPARFAIVAYSNAASTLAREWGAHHPSETPFGEPLSLAQLHLETVRESVADLESDEAIHVECIARTLRNILSTGELAHKAFTLVDAERLAKEATE
jgi:hypothetical protein